MGHYFLAILYIQEMATNLEYLHFLLSKELADSATGGATIYYMSKKSWHNLYSTLLYKMGNSFLDR